GNVLGRVGEVFAAIAFAVSEPVGENEGVPILLERLDVAPCRGMHRHREIAKFHAFLRGAPRVGDAALLSRGSYCTRGGIRCRCAYRPRTGGGRRPAILRARSRTCINRMIDLRWRPGRAARTRSAPMRVNDPRGFDFGLGETADMLRDSVRGFAT